MKTRILISSGGTGGHIFPAIATAEQLRSFDPTVELLFVGSEKGPERKAAQKAEIPFLALPVEGVLGKGLKSLKALSLMAYSSVKAISLVKKFSPHAAIGFGAYATIPPLLAARLLNIPFIIHEQNAMPGLSNRLLSRFANEICVSLDEAVNYFPEKKTSLTGNPVRQSIAKIGPQRQATFAERSLANTKEKTLFVMGGSLGAKALNSLIISNLERFTEANVNIIHQTGTLDYERVCAAYHARGISSENVHPFIDDMPAVYTKADLVLARAGASSIAELSAAALPSILIPFPKATHDHQSYNAKALVAAGAALMIAENTLPEIDATHTLLTLIKDPLTLARMGQMAYTCAQNEAASSVANKVLELATKKQSSQG